MVEGVGEGSERGFTVGGFELAFPYCYAMPSHLGKRLLFLLVSLYVAFYFSLPECSVGLWQAEILAPLVAVPETAVDEDDRAVFAHH